MEIIPITYANSTLPDSMVFRNGDEGKTHPIVFMVYLIKTDNKNILVDAGCETMPGFEMENFIGPINALDNIGIKSEDITDVVITHSHHDHIECVKYFKNAVIHIQEDEYEAGKAYIPDGFKVNKFSDEYLICDGVRIVKIGGHSKGSCIFEINTDNKTYVIAGDECYLRDCLEKKIPTGASYCPEKSAEFIEKYSTSKYTVLLCHDNR